MGDGFGELKKLAADLSRAGAQVAGKAAIAVRKTAADIEADAKRLAPVDTGNLMNSIGRSKVGGSGTLSVEIGPTAEYGVYVELGTSRMGAQPYMGPATDRHEPAFEAAMRQIGGELLG